MVRLFTFIVEIDSVLMLDFIVKNPECLKFLRNSNFQKEEMCHVALMSKLKNDPLNCSTVVRYMDYQIYEDMLTAVENDPKSYLYVRSDLRSYAMALIAIRQDPKLLTIIEKCHHTEELLGYVIKASAESEDGGNIQ
ncbi:hypothetical protein D3C71_1083270 [compost metagenome]